MKTEDFLLRVVALRDAQNRYTNKILSGELTDNVQEVIDLEKEIDDIISRLLTGEDKLEEEKKNIDLGESFFEYIKACVSEHDLKRDRDPKGNWSLYDHLKNEAEDAINYSIYKIEKEYDDTRIQT